MQKVQDLLWLWAILGVTILPAIRQFLVGLRRKSLIARIEKARGTKVITMIHRQGSGILGALFVRYIDLDDSERMVKAIRDAGDRPIDLLMHTPGGLVIAAEQIARALHAHKPGVTVVVPQYAMSGGTLLALAADEIILDENAMLGPIDPQLNNMPAAAYLRVLREKEPNFIADETIMMADMAAKATAQVRATALALLAPKLGAERAGEVATTLTEGRWTHDYPLHVEQVRELGLSVSTQIPMEFWGLLELSSPAQPKAMRRAADTK
jgi:ClpP class serine protease